MYVNKIMNNTNSHHQITEVNPKKPVTLHDEKRWQPQATDTVTMPKPIRPLTRKQGAMVQFMVNNPKASATEAVKHAYDTSSDNSASQIASENLRKPQVMLELEKHSGTAQLILLEVLQQSRAKMKEDTRQAVDWAVNARQTADSLLDRVHGKATQRLEQSTTAVVISIDLTGVTKENIQEN